MLTTQNKIQISCLGQNGRFGNWLFMYAFAYSYAKRFNCVLQTPNWIGEYLFNLKDEKITNALERTELDRIPWGETNIDLYGYFQKSDFLNIYNTSVVKNIFKFNDEILNNFKKPYESYIACHVRRGDYLYHPELCIVSKKSYNNLLNNLNTKLNIVWVSEETPNKNIWFEKNNIGYINDFLILQNADIILRANSTFSWWAATLSSAKVYSPLVEDKTGERDVSFIEGNWPRIHSTQIKKGYAILGDLQIF